MASTPIEDKLHQRTNPLTRAQVTDTDTHITKRAVPLAQVSGASCTDEAYPVVQIMTLTVLIAHQLQHQAHVQSKGLAALLSCLFQ